MVNHVGLCAVFPMASCMDLVCSVNSCSCVSRILRIILEIYRDTVVWIGTCYIKLMVVFHRELDCIIICFLALVKVSCDLKSEMLD